MSKKIILPALLFVIAASGFNGVYALDFNIRPQGFVFIPLGDGNTGVDENKRYSVGGGGDMGLEIDLASIWPNPLGIGYTAGIEGGLLFNSFCFPNSKNL